MERDHARVASIGVARNIRCGVHIVEFSSGLTWLIQRIVLKFDQPKFILSFTKYSDVMFMSLDFNPIMVFSSTTFAMKMWVENGSWYLAIASINMYHHVSTIHWLFDSIIPTMTQSFRHPVAQKSDVFAFHLVSLSTSTRGSH